MNSEGKKVKECIYKRESYAFIYFVRRSLATVVECSSCLTRIAGCQEFKDAKDDMGELQRDSIDEAVAYFNKNHERIKVLRNTVGGHILHKGVVHATESFDSEAGVVGWTSPESKNEPLLSLELLYAEHIVGGAIASTLPPGGDLREELTVAIEIIMGSYQMVQGSTYALVSFFLWPRFGV